MGMASIDLDALSRHPVVQKLMEKVHDSLGLTFLLISPERRIEGIPAGQFMSTTNALCARICREPKKGTRACLQSMHSLFDNRKLALGDMTQKPCHIGLQTLGAPIVVDGEVVGLILTCGFMRSEHVFEDEQRVAHRASRQGWTTTFDEALTQLRQAPALNVREVRIAASLMQLMVEQIVHFSRSSNADAQELGSILQALDFACPESPVIGDSELMRSSVAIADRSASKRLPTLILGEQGTGTTHLAKYLHHTGGFGRTPFVTLEARVGLSPIRDLVDRGFAGTIVVEHLELASPEFLEQLELLVRTTPDVFWISTSRAAIDPILSGSIAMVQIPLPSLRARTSDIAALCRHFLSRSGTTPNLTGPLLNALERYTWPGNVAELETVLQRAVYLGGLSVPHLPREIASLAARGRNRGFHDEVTQFKSDLLSETLQRTRGNVSQAARELGLQRTYLHRLMNELGVFPERDGAEPPGKGSQTAPSKI